MHKHLSNRQRRYSFGAILLSATAIIFLVADSWAQDDVPSPSAGQVDESANEIIVTAQRRSERLERVPMSVSVVTADTMAAAGISNLRDLAAVTSGYQLGQNGINPAPAIRGVTTILAASSTENNVAVYVDGLYQTVPFAIAADLPNIESVQVLKGPQGALYGRNATGGALLVTTINPGDVWQGRAEVTYARFDDKRVSGYVAGPLGDGIGLSLAGYVRRSDGYLKLASRTTPGKTDGDAAPLKQDAIRGKITADVTDDLSAKLALSYTRISDARTSMFSPIENVSPTLYSLPGGATRPTRLGVFAYDPKAILNSKQFEGGLTLDWTTPLGQIKSITGYSKIVTDNTFDFDGSYIPSSFNVNGLDERTFQQTVDLTLATGSRLDAIVGGTYFHDKLVFDPLDGYTGINPANPGTTPVSLDDDFTRTTAAFFRQKKSAWALYGDATFHATDQLSINAGGRYSKERQEISAGQAATSAVNLRPNLRTDETFSRFTPRASIRYEFAPRTNIYLSYSQGFRSGTFNSTLPACVQTAPSCYTPAKQETIKAYELGLKTASRRARFEIAGFYYDYRNLQVSATKTIGNLVIVDITNAPKAEIYGVEASTEIELFDNFKVRGGGTWLHARYGDNFIFSGVGASNASGVGLNSSRDPLKAFLNVNQAQDLSGLQMSRAPNFTGDVGVDYLVPKGDGGIRFATNLKYTTSYVITNPSIWGTGAGVPVARQREQRFREGSFALLNASITWTDPTNSYSVRLWGNNLTDHRYRLHYSGSAIGTYSPMAEPLTYGATVNYRF